MNAFLIENGIEALESEELNVGVNDLVSFFKMVDHYRSTSMR